MSCEVSTPFGMTEYMEDKAFSHPQEKIHGKCKVADDRLHFPQRGRCVSWAALPQAGMDTGNLAGTFC